MAWHPLVSSSSLWKLLPLRASTAQSHLCLWVLAIPAAAPAKRAAEQERRQGCRSCGPGPCFVLGWSVLSAGRGVAALPALGAVPCHREMAAFKPALLCMLMLLDWCQWAGHSASTALVCSEGCAVVLGCRTDLQAWLCPTDGWSRICASAPASSRSLLCGRAVCLSVALSRGCSPALSAPCVGWGRWVMLWGCLLGASSRQRSAGQAALPAALPHWGQELLVLWEPQMGCLGEGTERQSQGSLPCPVWGELVPPPSSWGPLGQRAFRAVGRDGHSLISRGLFQWRQTQSTTT